MNIQDHTLNGLLENYGEADFTIRKEVIDRFPERCFVVREDTDEAIGIVGKDFGGVDHPTYFGQIRGAVAEELGFTHKDFYDPMSINNDITIDTKVSRNGAWALEKMVFNNHKATVETDRHTTETALSLYAWHGVDGSTSNNVISGAIDFFCTNGMVTVRYARRIPDTLT